MGGVSTNIGGFLGNLKKLRGEIAVCTELLAEAVWEYMPTKVMENFDAGQSFWQPLKENTLAKRRAAGNASERILEDTLRLEGSLVNSPKDAIRILGANTVSYGTDVPYAPYMQYGVPSHNVPARPFMPTSGELSEFTDLLREKFSGLVKGVFYSVKAMPAKSYKVQAKQQRKSKRRAQAKDVRYRRRARK